MGDPRLLRAVARRRARSDTPELDALLEDMRDTMRAQNGRGPRRAADRRRPARRHLRCRAQSALSRCRVGALHRARQPRADAALRRDRGRLGGVPVGAGLARRRTSVHAAALRGLRSGGPGDRARGQRFSRARRPARMRPPRRHPVSDAHPRISAASASPTCCFPSLPTLRTIDSRRARVEATLRHVCAGAVAAGGVGTSAATLTVGPNGPIATIAQAARVARDDDIVEIAAGDLSR